MFPTVATTNRPDSTRWGAIHKLHERYFWPPPSPSLRGFRISPLLYWDRAVTQLITPLPSAHRNLWMAPDPFSVNSFQRPEVRIDKMLSLAGGQPAARWQIKKTVLISSFSVLLSEKVIPTVYVIQWINMTLAGRAAQMKEEKKDDNEKENIW